ncbi:hypothetical protein C8Q75DRAFT_726184 [Abortiporus biennis]|nr:hypothetical protein C8Q75DRAFT_726184 [Abortiporus biennis]
MPSFAERQAIQKKFNIDRRHIYDWYHTKGLRVSTKERTPAQQKPEPEKHDENNQRPRQQV